MSNLPYQNISDCTRLPPLDAFLCLQAVAENPDSPFANYTSCDSGGIPVPLTNEPQCAAGYLCPNIDVNQSNTWPQACAPTVECQLQRLGNRYCPPQGKYEPELCPPGYYCPDQKTKRLCPEGTWCIRGSTKPRPCPALSVCPPGTQIGRFYGGVLAVIVLDLLLLLLFLWRRYCGEPRAAKRNAVRRKEQLVDALCEKIARDRIGLDGGHGGIATNPLRAGYGYDTDGFTGLGLGVEGVGGQREQFRPGSIAAALAAQGKGAPPKAGPPVWTAGPGVPIPAGNNGSAGSAGAGGTAYVYGQYAPAPTQGYGHGAGHGRVSSLRPSPVVEDDAEPSVGEVWAAFRADAVAAMRSMRAGLSNAFTVLFTRLPEGIDTVVDFTGSKGPKLRVRTKSMRRASGSGPLFGLSDPDEEMDPALMGQGPGAAGMGYRGARPGPGGPGQAGLRWRAEPAPVDAAQHQQQQQAWAGQTDPLTADAGRGDRVARLAGPDGPEQRSDGSAATTAGPAGLSRLDRVTAALQAHGGELVVGPQLDGLSASSASTTDVAGMVRGPTSSGSTISGGTEPHGSGVRGGDQGTVSSVGAITVSTDAGPVGEPSPSLSSDAGQGSGQVQGARRGQQGRADPSVTHPDPSALPDPATLATMPRERLVGLAATTLLADGFRRCNAGLRMELAFQGLGLTLAPPINKTILSSVTGRIVPGRVTAIMGPSGAGKTTFLSVLMGKISRTAGSLRINGKVQEMAVFRRITGFVPQDDVMMRELTVRENIEHAARVRLPRRGWSDAQISRHVDAVIQVLGLAACADTLASRVSGGQRKRTNIGLELAVAPSAIFLDEPTSGLDSTAALEVCTTLKAIADLGLTVVAVIHQPRAEIYRSFDDILLLAPGGHTVYMGPQAGVAAYFAEAGCPIVADAFPVPVPVPALPASASGMSTSASHDKLSAADAAAVGSSGNPADELLDAIAGRGTRLLPAARLEEVGMLGGPGQEVHSEGGRTQVFSPLQMLTAQAEAQGSGVQALVPLHGADMSRYLAARWRWHAARTEGRRGKRGQADMDAAAAVAVPMDGSSSGLPDEGAFAGQPGMHEGMVVHGSAQGQAQGAGAGKAGMGEWQGHHTWQRNIIPTHKIQQRGAELVQQAATAVETAQQSVRMAVEAVRGMSVRRFLSGGPLFPPVSALTGKQLTMEEQLMEERGATVWTQFLLCHQRCLVQQYRQSTWLALELLVCIMAGSIMGLAATAVDELYSGVLAPPYTLLSPAPMETMLPSLGLYINMAVGVAGSPAAVRTFCEEREVYTREHDGGHSLLAYFLAKNLAATYRLALAALHFASFFVLLAKPTASFDTFLLLSLGIFFGVYGLSMLVSMAVTRENAALMGVIASLIVSCLCGFGPNLHQGADWGIWPVQNSAYSRWANELWMHAETAAYRKLYLVEEVSAAIFGYTLNRPEHDVGMMALIGIVLRVLGFGALVLQMRLRRGGAI